MFLLYAFILRKYDRLDHVFYIYISLLFVCFVINITIYIYIIIILLETKQFCILPNNILLKMYLLPVEIEIV